MNNAEKTLSPTGDRSTAVSALTNIKVTMRFHEDSDDLELTLRVNKIQSAEIVKLIMEIPAIINFSFEEPGLTLQNHDRKISLTKREKEVMNKLSEGLYYKEIAHELGISVDTVKNHLKKIYPKFRVTNRSGAIIKYLNH